MYQAFRLSETAFSDFKGERLMKTKLRALIIIPVLALLLGELQGFAGATTFNALDLQTAVGGTSLVLHDFYAEHDDAEAILGRYFNPEEETTAEETTEEERIPIETGTFYDDLLLYYRKKTGYCAAAKLLNLRAEPTVNSDTLYSFNRGDEIVCYGDRIERIVTRETSGDEDDAGTKEDVYVWYFVKVDPEGLEGYVRSEFVAFGTEGEQIAAEVQLAKEGQMPERFPAADTMPKVTGQAFETLKTAINDINYCIGLYKTKKEAGSYIDMYSILVYMCDNYAVVKNIADTYGYRDKALRAQQDYEMVMRERTRLSAETGNSEEDFYRGIQLESEEYKRKKAEEEAALKAKEEAERKAAEAEQRARELAEQQAREAAEREAERLRLEAEAAARAAEEAAQAAQNAAQQEAATIADGGAQEAAGTLGRQIADYARSFVGVLPYVWGGFSLTTGADCSGFVTLIYSHFNTADDILLPATRSIYTGNIAQYVFAYGGREVNWQQEGLQPGDLILYQGHVAIYYGNGTMIHEPDRGRKCEIGGYSPASILHVYRLTPEPAPQPTPQEETTAPAGEIEETNGES